MRTFSTMIPALLLVLAACSETVPSAPDQAGVSAAHMDGGMAAREAAPSASPRRDLRGDCTTTFNAPPFPLPASHEQTDTGSCRLSHLGATEIAGVQIINFATGTQAGTRTLTAANGDQVYTAHTGTSSPGTTPGTVDFVATLTITGGTGRFAGATGELRAEGTATLATRTTRVHFEGWIAY